MSLLLDTNVWLWWTAGTTARLSEELRHTLESEDENVSLSIASIWEIAIKASLGKIAIPSSPGAYALRQIGRQRFALLQIEIQHIDLLSALPYHHRDPFDRLIIAQAQAERMTLVTADRTFTAYEVETIVV